MSETKTKKTFVEIQTEYQQLALKAGHLQYQAYALTRDVELLNDQMRDLNFEGAQIQRAEEEAAKAASEGAKNETSN